MGDPLCALSDLIQMPYASGPSGMLKTFSMGLTWSRFQFSPDRESEILTWMTDTLPWPIQKNVPFPDFTYKKNLQIPENICREYFAARARHGPRWPERRNTSSTPRGWLMGWWWDHRDISSSRVEVSAVFFWKMSKTWVAKIAGLI